MSNARILIVEDEALIAEDIRWRLAQLSYEVLGIADSGEEALQIAEALHPDLVLMDGSLRGSMDGFETAHLIERLLHCPIIYITSNPRASIDGCIPIRNLHVFCQLSGRDLRMRGLHRLE